MSKCVGCGYCCMEATCTAGLSVHGNNREVCGSLEWNGDRYVCRLMTHETFGEKYRQELYEGAGCCSGLNSWRNDVRKRD